MSNRSRRQFYEHQEIPYDQISSTPEELEKAVGESDASVFSFSRKHLQTGRHVGLVQTSSESIEILPKIFEDKAEDLGLFLLLLRLTGESELRPLGTADLARRETSLLEVWIHHFAETLNELLQRQYQREYVEFERRSNFIRGKLLIEDMQAGRERLPGNYPCRHEVYTADNRLNQTIKYCNRLLLRETRQKKTRRLLEMNDILLKNATDRPVSLTDLDRIQITRLNQAYKPLLQLCRLILLSSSLDVRAGRIQQMSFTFDMASLFERAIAHLLRKNKRAIRIDGKPIVSVSGQSGLGKAFGMQRMKVDLELEDAGGGRTLIDTKYKGLQPSRRDCGVSREDIYQMYAYAKAGDRDYDRVVLLYPNRSPVRRQFQDRDVTLFIRSIDLRSIYDPSSGSLLETSVAEVLVEALSDLRPKG